MISLAVEGPGCCTRNTQITGGFPGFRWLPYLARFVEMHQGLVSEKICMVLKKKRDAWWETIVAGKDVFHYTASSQYEMMTSTHGMAWHGGGPRGLWLVTRLVHICVE